MRFSRMLPLVRSDLLRTVREPAALFMILLFPVVLTLAFGVTFGGLGGGTVTYSLGVVDLDSSPSSEQFQESLASTGILALRDYDDQSMARDDLSQGKLDGYIIINQGFGAACLSYQAHPDDPSSWTNSTVDIYLDKGSLFATQAMVPVINQVLVETVAPGMQLPSLPVVLGSPELVGADELTVFDYMAPGMFAFASIFLIMIVGGSFTGLREKGLLKRLGSTPMTASEFMASIMLSNMVLAALQTVLVFVVALAIGWDPAGGIEGFLFGLILLLVFSVCNVGFGLITATLAKSQSSATGLAFLFVLPQMFLGTFVGSMMGGLAEELGKFVPAYYVTDALTSVFVRGAAITSSSVLFDAAVVGATSVVVFLLGVMLFQRYGNR